MTNPRLTIRVKGVLFPIIVDSWKYLWVSEGALLIHVKGSSDDKKYQTLYTFSAYTLLSMEYEGAEYLRTT